MTYSEHTDNLTPNMVHLFRDGSKIGQLTYLLNGEILCESVWGHKETFHYPGLARAFIRACKKVRRGKKKYEEQRDIVKF